MKVKEFSVGGNILEQELNEWLENNKDKTIIDIKYSVASFSESKSYDSEYFGCALVLYE
ncbi:MAG: sporulation protein Cse60 [Bacilli bacterium]